MYKLEENTATVKQGVYAAQEPEIKVCKINIDEEQELASHFAEEYLANI